MADFQALYRRRFGVDLAWDEAADAMTALMQFLFLMDAPPPKDAPAPATRGPSEP